MHFMEELFMAITTNIVLRNASNPECPFTLTPVEKLKDPVCALPCQHIFGRTDIVSWMEKGHKNCPLDTRDIESLSNVTFVEDGSSAEKVASDAPVPEEKKISAEEIEKIAQVKRLVSSQVVISNRTEEMLLKSVEQITIKYESRADNLFPKKYVKFTGTPIDEAYKDHYLYKKDARFYMDELKDQHAEIALIQTFNSKGHYVHDSYDFNIIH